MAGRSDQTERRQDVAAGLAAARAGEMLRTCDEVENPVLRIVLGRARTGSRPRARADGHLVCLAIEGGMRGAVSAGMCVVLEAAGLVGGFPRVYGVSAGALNGWATAAGQAALSATHYQDTASANVINRMRPLVRRPVINFDLLFEELIGARKPLSFERLASGPQFRALATSLKLRRIRCACSRISPIVRRCCRRCGRAHRSRGSAVSCRPSAVNGWRTAA